jgi:sugar phosphate permease
VFIITWITYAGFYFCRKNLGIVLPMLHGISGLRSSELANVVFGYSLMYAVGQFGFGFLSDRIGAKRVVAGGMLLVVCSNLLMGVHASFLWLLVFGCLNGIGQSTGWSGLVKMMASWFSSDIRGIVMAWWGTNYVLGGFLATSFATWAVTENIFFPNMGWRLGFVLPALILLAITILFSLSVSGTPEEKGFPSEAPHQQPGLLPDRSNWSDLLALLAKPSLWTISISYFFLELCRYALMFWLPFYMVNRLKYSFQAAGYLSSLYELIGIAGALLAGYVSDRFMQSRRAPISAMMLFGLGCVLLMQPALAACGLVGTGIAISLSGVLSYGPDTLLSGAAAQDIGNVRATGTASGLVDGIGHLGSLFSPYVVVYVSEHYGWDRLFLVLAGSAFLAAAVLIPSWKLKPEDRGDTRVSELQIEQTA